MAIVPTYIKKRAHNRSQAVVLRKYGVIYYRQHSQNQEER